MARGTTRMGRGGPGPSGLEWGRMAQGGPARRTAPRRRVVERGSPVQVELVRTLYDYNRWVNERLLAVAEQVPPERQRERAGGSFDSIHGTLAHLLAAEIIWLSRWRGVSPPRLFGAADVADLAAIRRRWAENQRGLEAFLAELTPERLDEELHYTSTEGRPYAYPLWQMMVHVVNHGTHHRSELAELLTRAGHPPPPTDLIRYFAERSGQA